MNSIKITLNIIKHKYCIYLQVFCEIYAVLNLLYMYSYSQLLNTM